MFVLVLYSYTLIYEFIIGNKHEVVESEDKLWGLGRSPQPLEAIGDLGVPSPGFGDFL